MSPTKMLIFPNERVSVEDLLELEAKSKVLDPPQSVRTGWGEQVSAYTESYLDRLACAKAYEEDCTSVGKLKEPFKESGITMRRALDIIQESVVPAGTNQVRSH